jgi:CRP/FNR family cyclic AMP-dependent transcriptional regulator
MNAVLDQVRPVPLLLACGLDEYDEAHRLTERRHFFAGENIVVEGGTDRALWMVVSGRCEVIKGVHGHTERQLATIEPGGVFGEMSFLHPAPHSATVRAVTDVEVARLSPDAFDALYEASPDAAYSMLTKLIVQLSDRVREMDDRVCDLLEHAPDEKLQEWDDFRTRLFAGDFA